MHGGKVSEAQVRAVATRLLAPFARRIYMFGSAVTGETGDESDVDILVELKPPRERPALGLRWFALERELAASLGCPVDLVSDEALSPHLRPYVNKQKVLLYAEG